MFKKINENFKVGLNKKLLISSFVIYLIILVWAIIFKFMLFDLIKSEYAYLDETILFHFRYLFIAGNSSSLVMIRDKIINILLFLPLGLYLPLLFKKFNLFRDALIGFLLSLLLELIQGFTRCGCPSYIDIITNVIGLILGSIIFYLLKPITSDFIINYIQLGITVICLPIALYAIITLITRIDYLKPFFDFKNHPYIWY